MLGFILIVSVCILITFAMCALDSLICKRISDAEARQKLSDRVHNVIDC